MKSNKEYPSVEVIILTYNSIKNLSACLDSLKKTKYPSLLVTVVDQNTSDGSREMVEKKYKWVNLVKNKINNGFVGGSNQILRSSKAKYCILLNDDTTQDPDWVIEMVKVAERNTQIVAVQSKIRSLRDKKMFEYAGAGGGFIDIYGYPLCRGRVFHDMEEDQGQYDDNRQVFWCCGVSILIRRSVLKELGYLDEDYFMYSEELDLCWRMNNAGYKLFYAPKSVIYHIGSGTSSRKEYHFKKFYYLYRNTMVTIMKNYQIGTLLKILPIKIVLDMIAFANFFFSNPKQSYGILAAHLWILFNLVPIIKKNRKNKKIRKVDDDIVRNLMVDTSIVLKYYLLKNKKFSDYKRYIANY